MQRSVEEWLESKGVTLWADWDISDPGQRAKAAAWFDQQFEDFYAWLMAKLNERTAKVGLGRDVVA